MDFSGSVRISFQWLSVGAGDSHVPGLHTKSAGLSFCCWLSFLVELTCRLPPNNPASSQQAAPQAYRLGIIHFRALYSLIRLLPAYRLHRRLRRANNGLKIAVKLWAPEDYTSAELPEAWAVMERGLLGIDHGLETVVAGEAVPPEAPSAEQLMPPLELFGLEYDLSVKYRTEVDFEVQDMEAVLSEKLVDMEEEWFTPTVLRHRQDSLGGAQGERRPSGPSPIPPTQGQVGSYSRPQSKLGSYGKAATGSLSKWGAMAEGMPFASPPVTSPTLQVSLRSDMPVSVADGQSRASPTSTNNSGAAITARRLSGHFAPSTSPSTSLRNPVRPALSSSKPSSIGRTSSFLSQSGRSFTHAQLASMGHSPSIPITGAFAASPPIPGAMSGIGDASLSFSKQSVPRSLTGRPGLMGYAQHAGSPIIPGSMDRDGGIAGAGSSVGSGPSLVKRYSSYSARRERLAGSPGTGVGGIAPASHGSSGGEASLPSGQGGMMRRTSTRQSYESSSLRRSSENTSVNASHAHPPTSGGSGGSGSLSASRLPQAEQDDIEAFLKTLDALPQPPSVAAQAVHSSRTHLPSTSSSLSNPNTANSPSNTSAASPMPPTPEHRTSGSPPTPSSALPARAPMTKTQIDETLRQMMGSFNIAASSIAPPIARASPPTGVRGPLSAGVGLLSASRPASAPRAVTGPPGAQLSRKISGGRGAIGTAGSPLAREPYVRPRSQSRPPVEAAAGPATAISAVEADAASQDQVKAPDSPIDKTMETSESRRRDTSRSSTKGSRSLPGAGISKDADSRPLGSAGLCPTGVEGGIPITNALSPQTTGGHGTGYSRRGPVLLRGGFETNQRDRAGRFGAGSGRDKTSVSSSPSHSPIRDFGRLALRDRERETTLRDRVGFSEHKAEEELDHWARSAPNAAPTHYATPAATAAAMAGHRVGANGTLGRYRSLGVPVGNPGEEGVEGGTTQTDADAVVTEVVAQGQTGNVRGGMAPSSLGAFDRGRRGQVRSEGED